MLAAATTSQTWTFADLVSPALAAQLDRLDVLSRKVFSGKLQGERRSKRRGRSVEFDDYREYSTGDDLRHIDWNVLARLDRFFIKIFQEEEDLAVHVVIDCSPSMYAGDPSKVLLAARVATALGYIGLINNNRVLVTTIGSGRRARLEPLRGRRNVQRLTRFIIDSVLTPPPAAAMGTADPYDQFTSGLRGVATDPGGKGVMVVLSDLLIPRAPRASVGSAPESEPGYAPGLRLLAGAAARTSRAGGAGSGGLDVYVMQVLSPGELDPAAEGRAKSTDSARTTEPSTFIGDLRLQDAETGRFTDVTITTALLAKYKASVKRYTDQAADFCATRGMHHAVVSSDAPVDRLVAGTLRRAGLLG